MNHPTLEDDRLAGISEASVRVLRALPAMLEESAGELAKGTSLAQWRGIPEEELESLHAAARTLCDLGRFDQALPVALLLASHAPDQARYLFTSATCLQRMGADALAAQQFAQCLLIDPAHMAALFRLGECMSAMGEQAKAVDLFDAVVGMVPTKEGHADLQSMAADKVATLHVAGW